MARSESTIRVGITPEVAYEMWADLTSLREFLPNVLDVKKASDGSYAVTLRTGDTKESKASSSATAGASTADS